MSSPRITLTTDFGTRDYFVGAMKGVILGLCPAAQLVDLTHEIAPYAVAEGAYLIGQIYACYPEGTVHLAVVDPGVGSTRRALAIAAGRQLFVGPDNGLFSWVLQKETAVVHELTDRQFWRSVVGPTFHGRDVFAPVSAHLAAGVPIDQLGPLVKDPVLLPGFVPQLTPEEWQGSVLHVDRFGNAITNLPELLPGRRFELEAGSARITKAVKHFDQIAAGDAAVLLGSAGLLEVAVKQGSASERFGLQPGSPVRLSWLDR